MSERYCPRLTVSVIVKRGSKILFIRETHKTHYDVTMSEPTGHAQEGETLERAAIREVEEETGYRVKLS